VTRFDDIQARFEAWDDECPDDVRWLLDRVTRLETALRFLLDEGAPASLEAELAIREARAALDTEQT